MIEQVFAIPGLGRLVLGAIAERNYPLYNQVFSYDRCICFINFIVDILYLFIDPRISKND